MRTLVSVWFLLALSSLLAVAQEPRAFQVTGETEGQVNERNDTWAFSQFLFERVGRLQFTERWYPAQHRMPRYELAAGPFIEWKKGFGPFQGFVVKPSIGWAAEGSQYLLTGGSAAFRGFGHPVVLIIDRKNRLSGDKRGTFQYHKTRIQLWRAFWLRWEGTLRHPAPTFANQSAKWITSQLGTEVVGPLIGKVKPYASAQYDFVAHRWLSHFGFRF